MVLEGKQVMEKPTYPLTLRPTSHHQLCSVTTEGERLSDLYEEWAEAGFPDRSGMKLE